MINVDNIKTLLKNRKQNGYAAMEQTRVDIELTKSKGKALEIHMQKLAYSVNQFDNLLRTIEMDEDTDEPFENLHDGDD